MCLSGPRPLEYRTKAGFYPLDSNPTLENVKTSKVLFKVSFRLSPSQPEGPGWSKSGQSKSVQDYVQYLFMIQPGWTGSRSTGVTEN